MLRKWAGQRGFMMVVRNRGAEGWRTLDGVDVEAQATTEVAASGVHVSTNGVTAGQKRPRQETDDDASIEPPTKKPHTEPSSSGSTATSCNIPPPNPIALAIFAELDRIASTGTALPEGGPPAVESTGDVFLTQGWRERWCKCSNVSSFPNFLTIADYRCISVSSISLPGRIWRKRRKPMNPQKIQTRGYHSKSLECVPWRNCQRSKRSMASWLSSE